MLIAISGSQSTGKSTLIQRLNNLGFYTVERKTSRSILSEWGITLNEINNNRALTLDFQQEIIKRKVLDEQEAFESDEIYITERSFADLFSYFLLSSGFDNSASDFINNYYGKCVRLQNIYEHVFYLNSGLFNLEMDDVRGNNEHYANLVDHTMLRYTKQITDPDKLTIIDTANMDDRITTITDWIYNFE